MIIEFVGIQGAGKSTVAQLLARKLGAAIYPGLKERPPTLLGRWASRFADFALSPTLALAGVKHLRSIQSFIVLARLCRYDRFRRHLPVPLGQLVVLEEGAIHGLARIATDNSPALELLKYIKPPTMIVVVDTEPHVALQRIKNRKGSIDINHFNTDKALAVLRERRHVLKNIYQSSATPYIVINGLDKPEKLCNDIVYRLFNSEKTKSATMPENSHVFATGPESRCELKKGQTD